MGTSDMQGLAELRERFLNLSETDKPVRIRDAAKTLGVTEAELVSATLDQGSFALNNQFGELIEGMPEVGRVMCLCRNEAAVHERHGRFETVQINGGMGLVLGPDIDLRLFLRQWRQGFFLRQNLASGSRESLQFFDRFGDAILKIYLTDETDRDAFIALAERFRATDDAEATTIDPPESPATELPDSEINRSALLDGWRQLKDTHDFFGLLKRQRAGREQALRLAAGEFSEQVAIERLSVLFDNIAASQVPIMAFVANRGCIQVHSGAIATAKPMGPWLNLIDPIFNLHLNGGLAKRCWLVRKPSEDGIITSVEVFDEQGELIVQFFGARKPGIPEREDWRELLNEWLPENEEAAA